MIAGSSPPQSTTVALSADRSSDSVTDAHPEGAPNQTPSRDKALLTLAGLATTAFLLELRWLLYRGGAEGFDFVLRFDSQKVGPVSVATICFFFVALHLLRLYLGANFLDYDVSLRRSMSPEDRARTASVEIVFRACLISLATITPFLLGNGGYNGTARILFLQALLLVFYNFLYGRSLYLNDPQRVHNFLILFGDLVFGVAACYFAGCAAYPSLVSWSGFVIPLLMGAYSIVFLLEFVVHYLATLRALFVQVAFQKVRSVHS